MSDSLKVGLLVGREKNFKTNFLLKTLEQEQPTYVLCQDKTPMRFKEQYHYQLSKFSHSPFLSNLQDEESLLIPHKFKNVLFTDYPISIAYDFGVALSVLKLGQIASQLQKNVFAEVTLFDDQALNQLILYFQAACPKLQMNPICEQGTNPNYFFTASPSAIISILAPKFFPDFLNLNTETTRIQEDALWLH